MSCTRQTSTNQDDTRANSSIINGHINRGSFEKETSFSGMCQASRDTQFERNGSNIQRYLQTKDVTNLVELNRMHRVSRQVKDIVSRFEKRSRRTRQPFRWNPIDVTDLGQLVLQGSKRQVQGSNGWNAAQLDRAWGSAQTGPSRHNRVQYPCLGGCVTGTETQGRVRLPPVVSREDMTQLSCEKGPSTNGSHRESPQLCRESITTTTTTQAKSISQKKLKMSSGNITTTITIWQHGTAATSTEADNRRSSHDHSSHETTPPSKDLTKGQRQCWQSYNNKPCVTGCSAQDADIIQMNANAIRDKFVNCWGKQCITRPPHHSELDIIPGVYRGCISIGLQFSQSLGASAEGGGVRDIQVEYMYKHMILYCEQTHTGVWMAELSTRTRRCLAQGLFQ